MSTESTALEIDPKLESAKLELEAKIEAALAQRLAGNKLLVAGDLQGALRQYHSVLLQLRGMSGAIQRVYNPKVAAAGLDSAFAKARENENSERQAAVNKAISLTYSNLSIIMARQAKWDKSLAYARQCLALDKGNVKAKFREGVALVESGKITEGKEILRELDKTSPDAAITALLAKLDLQDKDGNWKSSGVKFKGMFGKKEPAQPKISEIPSPSTTN